ncbi:nucleoside 2-deoxyribosyltransferase [Chitiniphilus eburneus]|uniref:Nucleoside 2-deoxyribosyltransferase n=1 Tax=Chitiniphilus eburneus TaxID=2571148 RepID=A0A4U0Q8D7_9NEIS|nr:nucleoside 2-deoxyribosyltransferase [Chitiniphilus eburneus]TJZ77519.1 nucleoside 2-deoxyribosyltransferase [Chitiniphilus eburneus]
MSPPIVYLAGPGVFRQDAVAWGAQLTALCAQHGLAGLFPLDNQLPPLTDTAAQRRWLFQANCGAIHQADVVLADCRAFRSASEPDSGTAFEIGFAHALGKPVYLWLPDVAEGSTMRQRVAGPAAAGTPIDNDGLLIEDFAAPLNLMLWEAADHAIFATTAESAIAQLAELLRCST